VRRKSAAKRAGSAHSTSWSGNCVTLPDCCARHPAFTATALVTLAVCLGANLTIFAVVDSILLRPLPFPEAGRLVTVFNTYPKAGVDRDGSSIANYYERRGRIPAFAGVAIYSYGTAVVGEAGSTEHEQIARVSPDFFATLGTGPSMGRSFTEEETSLQTDKVVILTDTYWRQHFDADPQRNWQAASRERAQQHRWSASCRPASDSSHRRRVCTFLSRRVLKIVLPRSGTRAGIPSI
jgi:hypothetical protein